MHVVLSDQKHCRTDAKRYLSFVVGNEAVKKSQNYRGCEGPVVQTILDGVGVGTCKESDVVSRANADIRLAGALAPTAIVWLILLVFR